MKESPSEQRSAVTASSLAEAMSRVGGFSSVSVVANGMGIAYVHSGVASHMGAPNGLVTRDAFEASVIDLCSETHAVWVLAQRIQAEASG